jgi:hypothetical protein
MHHLNEMPENCTTYKNNRITSAQIESFIANNRGGFHFSADYPYLTCCQKVRSSTSICLHEQTNVGSTVNRK